MKLGEIKKLVREGDIRSITPELLNALGERYLEKFGEEDGWYGWYQVGMHIGRHHHHELAKKLKGFESSYPNDPEKQSLECCYVLADILAQTGNHHRSWLGDGIIDILNPALGTRVTKQHNVGLSGLSEISRNRSSRQFIRHLETEFQCIDLPQRNKYRGDEHQNEHQSGKGRKLKGVLITSLLENTCNGSKDVGGKGIRFAGKYYKIPQGVYNALKANHLVVEEWFSSSSVTLQYNTMTVKDLQQALISAIHDYSLRNNAGKYNNFWETRTHKTNIMYQAFEQAEEAEQYFQAAKPVVSVGREL
ncbi:hypothetical protein AVI51_01750 [Piscirickettsia salmonis]|uniref:Uncharacterized protein n=2 Tax=Piscirickettsia salmonis TaxID=1238 RepID=A0A9Q5V849_PISSA|nr:hypothetical protein [Piscirickettsia salmonis]ALA24781.1 hypothetical protein KW89_1313 [Piscirickettsia salmonis]APS45105.1 hypothetical protein AVI48_12460 [Piscirickettsia salmonis]APS48465.1 hypothetical protein AVI49_13070 [Piscirickettsia salmonis]APS49728.1 hypothetical protein AVI50_01795 [Piscirickettsia salmonis]APS52909.1 hypothetical protein AVI51_01750 [Piscirickettsia salmonis]